MSSSSEGDERSSSSSPKDEESATENLVDDNSSSINAKEETDKMSDGEPIKTKKKRKRSPRSSKKLFLDGDNSSTAAKVEKMEMSGKIKKKRKKRKRTSNDSHKPTVNENSSNVEVKEISETKSDNETLQNGKRKSRTPAESKEEEKAGNSSPRTRMSVFSENKSSAVEDVVSKWRCSGITDPKVKAPIFTDPGLPLGWRRKCVQRKTGRSKGRYDVYIFNPEGKKFRSRVELAWFLAATNSDLDPEDFDFSVYGHKAKSGVKKMIKSIMEMNSSAAPLEKKDVGAKSGKQSAEIKRSPVKKGRKPKDKRVPTQPQKKDRLKFTPTVKEIFKHASPNSCCLDCGKADCKYPYVILEHLPRPPDRLVKEGIKYQ